MQYQRIPAHDLARGGGGGEIGHVQMEMGGGMKLV